MLQSSQQMEFVKLWTLHGQRIYAYILTLTCNDADADEIYQDVGLTLWEKFEQFTPGTNFRSWAYRVALNKVLSFRQLRRHSMILCSPAFFDAVNRQAVRNKEMLDTQHQAFTDCYNQLQPKHKDLIERRYRPGATTKSVAAQTGRTVHAIYQALQRIHNALFDCVDKATLGESSS